MTASHTDWIYFQSNQISYLPDNEFVLCGTTLPANFQCSNIYVSDNRLRQSACAFLALGKHNGIQRLTVQDLCGSYVQFQAVKFVQGILILLYPHACESTKHIQRFFFQLVWPLAQQAPTRTVTSRTKTVVKLTALGFTSKEIACALFLSSRGVDYHLDLAKQHLGARNRSALVFLAMQRGWFA